MNSEYIRRKFAFLESLPGVVVFESNHPQFPENGDVKYEFPSSAIIRIWNDRCDEYVDIYNHQGQRIDAATLCQSKASRFDDYVDVMRSHWDDAIAPWLEIGVQLPIQFKWRGWAIGLRVFFLVFLMLPCVAVLYADLNYNVWPIFWLFNAASIVLSLEVIPLVRSYFSGPAFILSLDGLFFYGNLFAWHEISAIRYTTNGKGGRVIVVDLKDRKFRRGLFLRANIRLLAFCMKNSDDLVEYSRRLLSFSKSARNFQFDELRTVDNPGSMAT